VVWIIDLKIATNFQISSYMIIRPLKLI
jgi:hypothetical protein